MTKNNFFQSISYLTLISTITLFFWYYELESIGMPLFALIAFSILVFNKNTFNAIPFYVNMLFMISQTEWSLESIPVYLYYLPVPVILGFVFHALKYKINLFQGKMALPLLLMFAAMVSTLFIIEEISMNYLFYIAVGLVYLFTYLFFKASFKGDNLKVLIRLFVITGVMISFQVLIFYLRVEDIAYALRHKQIDLGWGISNFIATYLVMFISTMFYFMKKYKFHSFWIILAFFEIIMLLFTLSRGGILSFAITLIPLVVFLYYGYEKKVKLTLNIILGLSLVGLLVYFRLDYFTTVFERLSEDFFDDSGRFDLWIEAYDKFINNPLLGVGVFARVDESYFGFYHNTILHTMATLGTVGLVSILWQFLVVVIIFFKKWNIEKAILLIALFGANIHGMVDNVYYMPQFMVIFFIIIAAVENHNLTLKEDLLR